MINQTQRADINLRRIVPILILAFISTWAVTAQVVSTTSNVKWPSLEDLKKKWAAIPLDKLEQAAEKGDPSAEHFLGYCNSEGFRTKPNPAAGVRWYERALHDGYLPSASHLGYVYQRGLLGSNDLGKARYYYTYAAERGLAQAQVNLGNLDRSGAGVQTNLAEAQKWFHLAADQGHFTAMVELGSLYRFGQGVPQNPGEAEKWFQKAALQGDALGQLNLGLLYEHEGQPEKAFQLYQKAAEQGQTYAMIRLYICYWDGVGIFPDHQQAMQWLLKAAEAHNPYGEYLMGFRSKRGDASNPVEEQKYFKPNQIDAVRWFRLAAEQKWADGQYELGLCYLDAKGVEQDDEMGLELIRQAADQNHPPSQLKLARLYEQGIGEPRNAADRPIALLERVINCDAYAYYFTVYEAYQDLIFRHETGLGTERDVVAAVQWYCLGATTSMGNMFPLNPNHDQLILDAQRRQRAGKTFAFLTTLTRYLVAASSEDRDGLMQIGDMYLTGRDVPRSDPKAWLWYSLAAQNGVSKAGGKLASIEAQLTANELQEAKQLLPGIIKEFNTVAAAIRDKTQIRPGPRIHYNDYSDWPAPYVPTPDPNVGIEPEN